MSQPFLGQIMQAGFNYAPRGWALCQAQQLSIAQNSALYALLGTTFGGNGQTTFGLPDARGRAFIGTGPLPGGSTYTWGETAGTENVSILISNMPAHTHTATFTPTGGGGPATLSAVNANATTGTATAGYQLATAQPSTGATAPKIYAPAGSGTAVNLGGITGGGITGGSVVNSNTGGNVPISIMQPFQVVTTCIALQGIFPSRN